MLHHDAVIRSPFRPKLDTDPVPKFRIVSYHFPLCSPQTYHPFVSQDMLKSLSEEMDASLIPQAYGGENMLPLYESKQEVELQELVKRLNSSVAGAAQAHAPSIKHDGMQTNGK